MSFRTEEKILCSKSESYQLLKDLKKSGLKKLYPKRLITSLYFDNLFFQMHKDSEEGVVPRKKIRIRKYPEINSNNFLEIKISSIEGRFKKSNKISKKNFKTFISSGIFDKDYGICYPNIEVTYKRDYFIVNNIRITLDTEITYKNFLNNNFFKDNRNIFELKSQNINYSPLMQTIIAEPRIRFSKYCNAINFLIKN